MLKEKPKTGGSYQREEDGSLTKIEPDTPAPEAAHDEPEEQEQEDTEGQLDG